MCPFLSLFWTIGSTLFFYKILIVIDNNAFVFRTPNPVRALYKDE